MIGPMPDHAAFLRGMNVGGRRITNADLRAHFEALGLAEVGVFRASGNVVFTAPDDAALTARIEAGLQAALGYAVPVFLRAAAEIRAIAALEPFPPAEIEAAKGKLQVMLLLTAPGPAARRRVLDLAPDEDRLAFGERELYWLPSGGVLESALDLKAISRLVGLQTQRTMGTMQELARKYF